MPLIARRSQLSGVVGVMDIPVAEERIEAYLNGTDDRLVQEAFPELSADQREFIMTGITPEEWGELLGREDDDAHAWNAEPEEVEQPF